MFGMKKSRKRKLVITDPAEAVNNILYIASEYSPKLSIAASLYSSEMVYLDTIVTMFNDITDEEMRFEIDKLYGEMVNGEDYLATHAAVVIIHADITEASRIASAISDIPTRHHVEPFAIVVSDGSTWEELTSGESGYVDRTILSDFQIFSITDGKNIQPYG